jgi:hypothetical protein
MNLENGKYIAFSNPETGISPEQIDKWLDALAKVNNLKYINQKLCGLGWDDSGSMPAEPTTYTGGQK